MSYPLFQCYIEIGECVEKCVEEIPCIKLHLHLFRMNFNAIYLDFQVQPAFNTTEWHVILSFQPHFYPPPHFFF